MSAAPCDHAAAGARCLCTLDRERERALAFMSLCVYFLQYESQCLCMEHGVLDVLFVSKSNMY